MSVGAAPGTASPHWTFMVRKGAAAPCLKGSTANDNPSKDQTRFELALSRELVSDEQPS